MFKARVYRSSQRIFECKNLDSGEMVTATAYGNLLKNEESVVVGDYVTIEAQGSQGDELCITAVAERSSEIYRLLVRESKRKVTAANCDVMAILTSVSKPAYKRGFIDRFLVRAVQWNIKPIIIFNKMDEYNEDKIGLIMEQDRLKFLDVPCFEISAKQPDYKPRYLKAGMLELQQFLDQKTSIFLGQSGVGKSRTISTLTGGAIDLRVKQINRSGKGSHTTTWSEIIDCPQDNPKFYLVDSPGIRSFSLEDIKLDELLQYFPDLESIATKCQFTNCQHDSHATGCAFNLNNFSQYELDLLLSRLDSYHKIHKEISSTPDWQK